MNTSTRITLFSLIVLGIVAGGLWIMGGKKNEFSTSLLIDAQPQQVFPYLTQPEQIKQWFAGLESVEAYVPSKPDIPTRITTTTRVITSVGGGQTTYQDQVIRFEADSLLSIQSRNANEIITWIYELEPDKGKTRLNYRVKTENRGIGRFMAPLQKTDLEPKIESDARSLKELIETNEPKLAPTAADKPLAEVPFVNEGAGGSDVFTPIEPETE
jgi:uncharacterized protein YndB with AHSA1/START domain